MINPIRLFSSPFLEVEWDDIVRHGLKPHYQNRRHARIPIRLFDLLKGLGCVQPRRVNPSLVSSLLDYGYLIERLYDSRELRVKVSETRDVLSSEMLTEISGLMGMGLSVVVVSKLFDIQQSTIIKIKGTSSKRPDWKCLLSDNRTLLVEAKGSISKDTSKQQLKDAVTQKNAMPGDVKIAAASVLNESVISNMSIIDPPVIEEGEKNYNRRHIYRANHYASVFSFLGDDVLSIYFEKMAKRLSGRIGEIEMGDKELMYKDLSYHAPRVYLNGAEYAGHLYGPVDNQYLFLGVDKRLLSYRGFIDFQDAEEERIIEKGGNQYLINSDGILVINVSNAESFFREYAIKSTGVSLDCIALSELDSIRGNSFKRYVKYLLDKCGSHVEWVEDGRIKATIDGIQRYYSVFHVRKTIPNLTDGILERLKAFWGERNSVLVTNLSLPRNVFPFSCVDRTDFAEIASHRADVDLLKEIFSGKVN